MRRSTLAVTVLLLALGCATASAAERFITLASTTVTEQSGLFSHLLPIFQRATGISVRVVAAGAAQALAIGARGEADVVLVHDRADEDRFIANGHGIDRRAVMYNDFIIVGPRDDPALIRGLKDAKRAFRRIAITGAPFVSRGDDSVTSRAEQQLWKVAGIDVSKRPVWYRALGLNSRATLSAAASQPAYTFANRPSWVAFHNRRDLEILTEGDPAMFNSYGSILVNPAKGTHIKAADAKIWHEWLTGPDGRAAISTFRIEGEQVYFPLPAD